MKKNKRFKLSVVKEMSHGDVMYKIGNIVNSDTII